MRAFPPVVPLPSIEPWTTPGTFIAKPRAGVAGESFRPMPGLSQPLPETRQVAREDVGIDPAAPIYTRNSHQYATTGGSAAVALTTASTLVLAETPTRRNFLMLRNAGANPIVVAFGIDTNIDTVLGVAPSAPIYLVPNQMVLFDIVVPQDDIYASTVTGLSTIAIAAANIP